MSIHIPDRHSRFGPPLGPVPPLAPPGGVLGSPPHESLGGPPPEWTQGPPPGWHATPEQPHGRPPRRRRRLVLGLAVLGVVVVALVAGLAALLGRSGIIVNTDPEGDDQHFLEEFGDTGVPFELFDDGKGSATVHGGVLILESSIGDMLDYWIVGPMDSARIQVDVAAGPGSYGGTAIGGPYGAGDSGWYVTAQITDSGQLYLYEGGGTSVEKTDGVAADPGVKVSLEMTHSEDGTEQTFTAVLMEPLGSGVWVSVDESELSLTLPAREASAVFVSVGPMEGPAADGTFELARAAFDNFDLSYDPAG
ncbi:hypothetical protein [Actinotalea ferrariae]|uniref:hypothetical protein n=1 Tax=Actinotalea ferrariae TaxID=1386098 RepID=UPI0012DD4B17|nr:hypothetical protein [Actinotalea ferrariae]